MKTPNKTTNMSKLFSLHRIKPRPHCDLFDSEKVPSIQAARKWVCGLWSPHFLSPALAQHSLGNDRLERLKTSDGCDLHARDRTIPNGRPHYVFAYPALFFLVDDCIVGHRGGDFDFRYRLFYLFLCANNILFCTLYSHPIAARVQFSWCRSSFPG